MRIAVVGAGLAGLRTAMLLQEQGVDITVFEARERLGGRLFTTAQGFELGAEWVDADHRRMLSLMNALGLKPEPAPPRPYLAKFGSESFLSDALPADVSSDTLRVDEIATKLADGLNDTPWLNESFGDTKTLANFLDEHSSTAVGRWWNEARYRSDEGDDTNRIGLLGWLCGYKHYVNRAPNEASAFRIPGGANALVGRMVDKLRRPPITRMPLTGVEVDGAVTLNLGETTETFDHAVLTSPPKCCLDIRFTNLPVKKPLAWSVCGMSRAVKIAMEFSQPFWEVEGWHGNLFVDSPLQQVWNSSKNGKHILNAYVCGDDADGVVKRVQPVEFALDELCKVSPKARTLFLKGEIHDWIHDTYSQGAFSHLPPGFVLKHMRHLGEPVGPVHFAGEHTALWTGFLEGALESAERVVAEITSL